MYLIQRKSAVEAVYILMSVDGRVEDEEMAAFDEIGAAIDGDDFPTYRDDMIASAEARLQKYIGSEDWYDILSETVDAAIDNKAETCETGIPARMLVWNSLMMSYADGEYEQSERRLIRHIYRVTGIPDSVYLEMEQLIKAYAAVCSKLSLMSSSDLPYSQIRPVVDDLEERKKTLTRCATELIADEVVNAPEPVTVKDDFVDKAAAAIKPKMKDAKEAAGKAFDNIKEKSAPGLAKAKEKLNSAKGSIASFIKKKKNDSENAAAGAEEAEKAEGKED